MFKQENGFTLAEIVAGVIILMILATVVGLAVFGYIKDARVASLKEEAIAVENDLLTNAGSYDYEGKEASDLSEEVRAVLGYHESLDTKLEGLVFEDKALRSEGEIHVGKLSMPESELGNYDFSESGVKQMKGNGIGDQFYVYDELGQVESNVGLLGDGTLTLPGGDGESSFSDPDAVDLGFEPISFSIGEKSAAAVNDKGEVFTWGIRDFISPYNGPVPDSTVPVLVEGLPKVTKVSVGFSHFLAVGENGKVYSWGTNRYGHLGIGVDGDSTASNEPIEVAGLSNIVDVVANEFSSYAMNEYGTVYGWGDDFKGEISYVHSSYSDKKVNSPKLMTKMPNYVKKIDAGFSFGSLLTKSGDVYMWGDDSESQLGIYGYRNSDVSYEPTHLSTLPSMRDIASNSYNNLGVSDSGELYYWGRGRFLGFKDYNHRPMKVEGVSGVEDVYVGFERGFYTTESGELYMLKNNEEETDVVISKVDGITDVENIETHEFSYMIKTEDGKMYVSGRNTLATLLYNEEIAEIEGFERIR